MTFYLRKIIEKRLGAALGRTPKKQQRECLTVSTQKMKFSIKKSFHESPFLLVITSPCKMYLFRQAPFENIILLYSGRNVLIIIEKNIRGSQIFISSIMASVTDIASILFWKYPVLWSITAQKMKFSIKDFFSKCDLKSRF